MSEVVKLEPSRRVRARGPRRRRPSKTALVLGGGGFTGAVYEIGALRALDLLAVNTTVNDFDVYVGTSAGSFVGASMANGITPEEMMRALNPRLPSPFRDMHLSTLLRPNYGGLLRTAARMPRRVAGVARDLVTDVGNTSIMDVLLSLATGLPAGFYEGAGIEEYMREILSDPDRTDDFTALERELYITATDVDTTERLVFGGEGWDDVPISTAVRASTALPVVYEPVEVRGRTLMDGGIRSTTNIDVAVEHGAKFIVVVNPLVPYVNDFSKNIPTGFGSGVQRISELGAMGVANQAFRMLSHDRLHRAVREWENAYPGVDIILVEPELDDSLMFGTSIMDYSARLRIARHGFESVTLRLAREYDRYKEVAGRHGLEISQRRVARVLDTVTEGEEDSPAWRRVFEQTTSALLRQAGLA